MITRILFFLLLLTTLASCNVHLLQGKISKKLVDWNDNKITDKRKHFRTEKKLADVASTDSETAVALRYLGAYYTVSDKNPATTNCNPASHIFTNDQIKMKFGKHFDFDYTFQSKFDVTGSVNADLAKLKGANPNLTQAQEVQLTADLTAAYNKAKNDGIKASCFIYMYFINDNGLIDIDHTFSNCLGNISDPETVLIRGVTFIKYQNFNYSENSISQIESDLKIALAAKGINANVELSFQSTASIDYQSNILANAYQILYWDFDNYQSLKAAQPRHQSIAKFLAGTK